MSKKQGVNKPVKKMAIPIAILLYVISAVLVVALIIGNLYANRYSDLISIYLNQPTEKISTAQGEKTQHYVSSYKTEQDRLDALHETGTNISREGITLLKNDHGTLPISSSSKISVFGQDAVDPLYGGVGASAIDSSSVYSLKESLTKAGLKVNPTLWNFYEKGEGSKYRKSVPNIMKNTGYYAVNEVPASKYTQEVKDSYKDYSDAAVVVIGRSGGEAGDLSVSSIVKPGVDNYLALDQDEKDMLKMVSQNFKRIIVVLNTSNPMEISPLDQYGVGATVWTGIYGESGAKAVGEILTGKTNPSGHLSDTYPYDLNSSPSMVNAGDYTISNSKDETANKYIVEAEGIYSGYRYYETRYEDVVLGNESRENFNYQDQVQYAFGHGLSYTDFKRSDFHLEQVSDGYNITVKVTNTGSKAGKDVVQLYLQSPYTDYDKENSIEKSAVTLAGYAKTDLLKPGASQEVKVHVSSEQLRTYDSQGHKTYIRDAGKYYFAVGDDAHDALNNILAAKGKTTADGMDREGDGSMTGSVDFDSLDATTYATSKSTGKDIVNRFQDADIKTYDPSFRYLSRSDWKGTWPQVYANGKYQAPSQLLDATKVDTKPSREATEAAAKEKPKTGVVNEKYGELTAASMIGKKYDDPKWKALIEQIPLDQLEQFIRIGGYGTKEQKSIQLPQVVHKDGTAGYSKSLVGGEAGVSYPSEVVLGATWNTKLAEDYGKAIGEDSLKLKVAGWYAPGANIHRTPFGGRNFEYFAEDPTVSGEMSAAVVKGAQSKGVLPFMKHFAMNDLEINRMGGLIFANEQSMREVYLKGFEMTVRDGGCKGVMSGMNRIGPKWAGGDSALVKDTLRGEWGFKGVVVTDQASFPNFTWEDIRQGMASGNDLWLNTDAKLWRLSDSDMTPGTIADMQQSAKNIVYATVNSNAMNGLSEHSKIVSVTPLWKWGVYALDVVVILIAAGLVFISTRGLLRRRRTDSVQGTSSDE